VYKDAGAWRLNAVVASIIGWSAATTSMVPKRYGHIGSDVQPCSRRETDGPSIVERRRMTTCSAVDAGENIRVMPRPGCLLRPEALLKPVPECVLADETRIGQQQQVLMTAVLGPLPGEFDTRP
jgi:hypothetical protein